MTTLLSVVVAVLIVSALGALAELPEPRTASAWDFGAAADGRDYPTSSLEPELPVVRWCLGNEGPVFWARACNLEESHAALFEATNGARRWSGAPSCWWHASVEEIARVRGVTWPWAALAVKIRDEEGPVDLASLAADARMGTRGARIAAAMTDRCALRARP